MELVSDPARTARGLARNFLSDGAEMKGPKTYRYRPLLDEANPNSSKERVRDFFVSHIGCSQKECAKALDLNPNTVSACISGIRKDWRK